MFGVYLEYGVRVLSWLKKFNVSGGRLSNFIYSYRISSFFKELHKKDVVLLLLLLKNIFFERHYN